MMATMLSSPIGPSHGTGRYDPFDQPSSPSYKHDELPSEFGDQSFGSSMSLGSSFELSRMVASSSSSSQLSISALTTQRNRNDDQATIRISRRSPPRYGQDSLGAAMGTVLNSRSPGLASKMSPVDYMDMSSPPSQKAINTPSKASRGLTDEDEELPPGSAMKEDTPVRMTSLSRKTASETSAMTGGSLGRLFGTELSQNTRNLSFQATSGHLGEEKFELQISPDEEPPQKKRPSSLPLSHAAAPVRPSLRSVGMAPPSGSGVASSRRPSLLKSMTTGQGPEGKSASKRTSLEALRQQHRASDSNIPTTNSFGAIRPIRSRSSSSELHENREVTQLQRNNLPALHPTIIESPSPSTLQNEGLSSYFFDPQSPDHGKSIAQQSSISSKLGSASLAAPRPRAFEKSATSAIVPSMMTVGGGGAATAISASQRRRMNPYAKRPSLNALQAPLLGQFGSASTAAPASIKMTAPAPRRCQSAVDNSAAFAQAAEDMSMSSVDGGDQSIVLSPSDHCSRKFPPGFDASGSPIAPSARPKLRPGLLRRPSKDDSSPLGYGMGKRLLANNTESLLSVADCDESGSSHRSADGLPGFGASEREGKILPCFNVKDDGLMRITPTTLVEVLSGKYTQQMDGYQIVDCRFGYEFEGGHITGAINLSTMEKVKRHFLQPEEGKSLPLRSQSGKVDDTGTLRKKVLIFHCEFSCKRAPSMALALRQADRSLAHDYPNCHYPEVYILQGGYCGFFKEFANACEPKFYVEMDDPKFQEKRSVELNGFRKQFSRHRSFAYGDGNNTVTTRLPHSDGSLLNKPAFVRQVQEEESSFENSASPSTVQADVVLARRRMSKGNTRVDNFKGLGVKPVLLGSAPVTVGDISFGSSVGDESSFEGGPSDSPCAAAATNRRPSAVMFGKPSSFGNGIRTAASTTGSLGRTSIQRASTASHITFR